LTHLGWVSIGVIFAAGLLTSLTPWLSMLPITIGYIGGYEKKPSQTAVQSTWFSLGLATLGWEL